MPDGDDHDGLSHALLPEGNVLGIAVCGSLFGSEVLRLQVLLGQEPLAVAGAYRYALTIGAGIALAGALTSLVRGEGTGGRNANFKLKTDN